MAMLRPLLRAPWLARPALARPAFARVYSIHVEPASRQLPDIDPAKLVVTQTQTPKPVPAAEGLVFGQSFTGVSHRLCAVMLRTLPQLGFYYYYCGSR